MAKMGLWKKLPGGKYRNPQGKVVSKAEADAYFAKLRSKRSKKSKKKSKKKGK